MTTRGSNAWRQDSWGAACQTADMATVSILGIGRITCHTRCIAAFEQLGLVFRRHGYQVRSDVTGCFCCRHITGGTVPSSHSWGTSIDVNWDTNPYRRDRVVTDMPAPMIDEACRIRTVGGVQVFRWGGDWDGRPDTPNSNYDAMHWEIIATPAELDTGFAASMKIQDPRTWPVLKVGAVGDAVRELQHQLGIAVDGGFGDRTLTAVKQFQTSRGLVGDGVVGLATWTALVHEQPALDVAGASPTKGAPAS